MKKFKRIGNNFPSKKIINIAKCVSIPLILFYAVAMQSVFPDNKELAKVYMKRGIQHYAKGLFTEAIEQFTLAYDNDKENKTLSKLLGKVYAARGTQFFEGKVYNKALDDFNEALKFMPDNPELVQMKEKCEESLFDYEEVEKMETEEAKLTTSSQSGRAYIDPISGGEIPVESAQKRIEHRRSLAQGRIQNNDRVMLEYIRTFNNQTGKLFEEAASITTSSKEERQELMQMMLEKDAQLLKSIEDSQKERQALTETVSKLGEGTLSLAEDAQKKSGRWIVIMAIILVLSVLFLIFLVMVMKRNAREAKFFMSSIQKQYMASEERFLTMANSFSQTQERISLLVAPGAQGGANPLLLGQQANMPGSYDDGIIEKLPKELLSIEPRVRADGLEEFIKKSFEEFQQSGEMDREKIEIFKYMTHDQDNRTRGNACLALYQFDQKSAISSLVGMLKDANVWMKVSAFWVLGKIGDAQCMETILSFSKDQPDTVKEQIKKSLNAVLSDETKAAQLPGDLSAKMRETLNAL